MRTQAQNPSAPNSQPSATPVDISGLLKACNEAAQELAAARKLINAQDSELKSVKDAYALERQITELLKQKDSLSSAEIEQLRNALSAKDRVIAALEAELAIYKKKNSVWSKLKWFIVGAAAGIITGAVVANE